MWVVMWVAMHGCDMGCYVWVITRWLLCVAVTVWVVMRVVMWVAMCGKDAMYVAGVGCNVCL
ncbi:hypothetical protein [uncultured Gardnerella sp.]|uniref:hypothetical protein n=1 Tax=uncultured Gardnerella sp. TaxID=293424 RepID=UPI0025F03DFB|nr:hypothetical protein [uncultured Gardnerella sp.]